MSRKETETIQALNQLLRGELAAVETYNQALTVLRERSAARAVLEQCRSSHASRALRLRLEILGRRGQPTQAFGPWGAFTRMLQTNVDRVEPERAIRALDAGEDHESKEYEYLLPRMDLQMRDIVAADIYVHQRRTRKVLSTLRRQFAESSVAAAG